MRGLSQLFIGIALATQIVSGARAADTPITIPAFTAHTVNWQFSGTADILGNRGQVDRSNDGKGDSFSSALWMTDAITFLAGNIYTLTFSAGSNVSKPTNLANSWLEVGLMLTDNSVISLAHYVGSQIGSRIGEGALTTKSVTFSVSGSTTAHLRFDALAYGNGKDGHGQGEKVVIGGVKLSYVPETRGLPGPVAGAGLPFLLAAGAFWMRRRNTRA